MDNHNPLDEVTSREFIKDALLVGMIMGIIVLMVFIFVTYFSPEEFITSAAADEPINKPVECHVYYHQHNKIHEWKGEVK